MIVVDFDCIVVVDFDCIVVVVDVAGDWFAIVPCIPIHVL
jgi:hypothetical protein